jgi:hypothetical protein
MNFRASGPARNKPATLLVLLKQPVATNVSISRIRTRELEVALFIRQFLKYHSVAADLARVERVTQSIADQVE